MRPRYWSLQLLLVAATRAFIHTQASITPHADINHARSTHAHTSVPWGILPTVLKARGGETGASGKLEGLTGSAEAAQEQEPYWKGGRVGGSFRNWDPKDPKCKFVIVTGGVISGIGKGVTASSLGLLLKMMNFRPTAIKIDPYLNVDAGTMSPFEHGEVFVLDDGGETDLDLGNYERFLNVRLTNDSNLTTGKVYQTVIEKERRGEYLGKTVQVVPHITNAIQDWILRVAHQPVDGSDSPPNVCVIELGGTLGDIESMPFVEALRQLQDRVGYKNCCFLHVSMVPKIGSEQKTKPTQHSVRQMRELGLIPDFLICRSPEPLHEETTAKIAMFCQVPIEHVISVHDVSNIFRVPLLLMGQKLHSLVWSRLRLHAMAHKGDQSTSTPSPPTSIHHHDDDDDDHRHRTHSGGVGSAHVHAGLDMDQTLLSQWKNIAGMADDPTLPLARIAVVGKYTGLRDSYLSIHKALQHAAMATGQQLEVEYLESSQDNLLETLSNGDYHGLLVPGGFGGRGLDGKVAAIRWARESGVPFLGICLGMQAAVIEYARHVLGWERANSAEFQQYDDDNFVEGRDDVVIFMPEGDRFRMGGTMRLGARTTIVKDEGSLAWRLYSEGRWGRVEERDGEGKELRIDERHRHRYEVNPALVEQLEAAGLRFVGRDTSGQRMEILELGEKAPKGVVREGQEIPGGQFFVGVQFHPEFKSRPTDTSPLFLGFLRAAGVWREVRAKAGRKDGEGVEGAIREQVEIR